jgi:hypothetical protein
MSVVEFEKLPPRPIIAHKLLKETLRHSRPFTSLEPALITMARLTAESKEAIRGEEIDSLEPLYLTEFKPS